MIFPNNKYLKICMYTNALIGIWPYIFEEHPKLKKMYKCYSNILFSYDILFILTAYIKLVQLITADEKYTRDIFANLSVTLIFSISIVRVCAMRSERIEQIIREVIDSENKILTSGDEQIIKIYNTYVLHCYISNLIFIINIVLVSTIYVVHSLIVDDVVIFDKTKNETIALKAIPLSSWVPFDENKHYLPNFLWNVLDGCIGASFLAYSDILSFSLIIFSLGKIHILKHIVANFDHYVMKTGNQIGVSKEEASFITMRECILHHKEIMRFISGLNEAMRSVMLLDFLQSSIQLASLVLQLFTDLVLPNIVLFGQFIFSMLIRLLLYYWYGNEISHQSSDIANAIWNSKWYEQTPKVKKIMLIMMMRCMRNLCLEIGPFSTMSLGTFINILKAAYSYMMVFYRR